MQPKFSLLFIKPTSSNNSMMVRVVVLALSLMTATFALPVTPEGQVATEFQGAPQTQEEIQSQQVEKTGYQGSPESYTSAEQYAQQNAPVPKVENVQVGNENVRPYQESSVLLPIQPLSVVPVNAAGQVFRPVIVPAEAITTGRVIIAGLESIQQRSFQDTVGVPEKQAPQIVQPLIYTPVQTQDVEPNQQPYYVQPAEKVQQEVQQTEQIQVQSNEEPLIRERVEGYNPVTRVYTAQQQNVQPESQAAVQSVEPEVQQQQIQKQVPYQQYPAPIQSQEVEPQYQQAYSGVPTTYENVEKQGQQVYNDQQAAVQQRQLEQVSTYTPTQPLEHDYKVQPVQEQVPNVQSVEHQVYNVQPIEQQVYNVQPVEQQVYNVQPVPSEKQGYDQTQQYQTQSVRQSAVEQVHHQQPFQTGESVPVQPVYQQQVYNAAVGEFVHPTPYQQGSKPIEAEPHHVESYAAQPPYNYGVRLPQVQHNNPAHVQNHSVRPPSVVSPQE